MGCRFRLLSLGAATAHLLLCACLLAAAPLQGQGTGGGGARSAAGLAFDGEPVVTVTDPVAAEIIQHHLRVLGGSQDLEEALRRLRAVRTVRVSGSVKEGVVESTMQVLRLAPNRIRVERARRDRGWDYLTITAFDGSECWIREEKPKRSPAQELKGWDALDLALEAELHGPFLDYEERGYVFTYEGEARVGNQATFHLRGRLRDGEVRHYYLNQSTYLLVCMGYHETFAGRRLPAERFPTRMARQNGVLIERGYVCRANGEVYRTVNWDKVEVNVELAENLFTFPDESGVWLRAR